MRPDLMTNSGRFGVPDWIRTNGLSLRRRPLYPAELRGHIELYFTLTALHVKSEGAKSGANFTKPVKRQRKCSRFLAYSRLFSRFRSYRQDRATP